MKQFSLDESTLILVIILVLLCIVVLMAAALDCNGQVVPTWTPRPTMPVTLTCEAFLPLVEKSATPTR